MADQGNIRIHIGTDANTQGVEKTTESLGRMKTTAKDAIDTLKLGVGIDIGGRIVNQVAQLPDVLQEGVRRGVEFNATLENTQTAVAAVLEKFQGLSRQQALEQAGTAVDELKRKAVDAPGTVRTLAEAWIASSGAAAAANIPINQQIDLIVRLSQAVSRLALPQQQLVQETRALLTGNITLDAQLAKTLGITNQMVEAAKSQGNLYGFLVEKIGALGEASDTLEVRWSNLQDTIDQALGEATKEIFDQLREGVANLNEAIKDPETVAALKSLGHDIGEIVNDGLALTEWAIRNADALLLVAKGAALIGVAFAAMKIKDIVVGLAGMTANLFRNTTAIDAETKSLTANTAAQNANTTARSRSNAPVEKGVTSSGSRPRFSEPYSLDAYKAARAGGATATDAIYAARRGMYAAQQETVKLDGAFAKLGRGMGNLVTNVGRADVAMGGLLTWVASLAALEAGKFAINQGADAITGWAATGNIRSGTSREDIENSQRLQNEQGAKINEFIEQAKKVTTVADRDALMKSIGDYQASLANSIDQGGHSNLSNEVITQTTQALSRVVDSLSKLDNLALQNRTLDSAIADAKQRQVSADAGKKVAGDIEKEGDRERAANAFDEANQKAADRGDVSAIDKAIEKKIEELKKAHDEVAKATDEATGKIAGEALNKVKDALAELRKLRTAAAEAKVNLDKKKADDEADRQKDANEKAVKALEDQIKLVEELGRERIAQAKLNGGSEEEIARKRLEIEKEIAKTRLELQNKIGGLQGENPEAKAAREAGARADLLESKADFERDTKEKKPKSKKERRKPGDPIDASAQRSYDLSGNVIEEDGVAKYGRTAMGTLKGPSVLDTMTGPGWDLPRRTTADLMPQPSRQAATQQGTQPTGKETESAGTNSTKAIEEATQKAVAAIENAGRTTVAGLDRIAASAARQAAAISGRFKAVENALAKVESQVRNNS